jgi:hypothetical protein
MFKATTTLGGITEFARNFMNQQAQGILLQEEALVYFHGCHRIAS